MAEPMKVRTIVGAEYTEVRVLMLHPMETGLRKDQGGNLVPAHFIQEMSVRLNGKVMVEGQVSQGVSRNPVFLCRLKGAKPGDKLEVAWLDNRGDRNRTEVAVA